MAISNLQIAKLLRSVSAALSLSKGDNRFRIIAYDRAADAIEHASSEVKDLWDDGKLKELSGVGEGIASSLDELFRTGKVKHFETILKDFPPAMFQLMEIPGLGPKNAFKLCKALGITRVHFAVSKLEKAAKTGKIAVLEGFGEESQNNILQNIDGYKNRSHRLLLNVAHGTVDAIIAWMHKIPQVKQIDYLGSLRRQASTVGDIDIAVATDDSKKVLTHFTQFPGKSRVLEAGEHTSSIILPNGSQVDLMVQPPQSYGSLLQHFTGSKHHNIALRELAMKKGYSLSEYGITPLNPPLTSQDANRRIDLRGGNPQERVIFSSEEKLYNFLGLDFIPPELREGENEIELAKLHQLPKLVELSDIKGDLHIHSDFNIEPSHDLGTSSINQIVEQAVKLDYEYVGLTDHNPSVANHSEKQMLDLIKKRTNFIRSEKRAIYVFNGMEIDLQPDGKRAVSDKCLQELDYACVSIHSSFRQSRKDTTLRVLRGLDHPKIKFLAHPTGRLLQEREGVELDWDQIFDFCVRNHKWLEIDAWPTRLDLPDVSVHEAIRNGVKIIINSDSHAADQLLFMKYGVSVARRGWATKTDIINTCNLKQIGTYLN